MANRLKDIVVGAIFAKVVDSMPFANAEKSLAKRCRSIPEEILL